MCKRTTPNSNTKPSASSSTGMFKFVIIYTLGFIAFRMAEIANLAFEYPIEVLTSLVASLMLGKATSSWNLVAILSMVALVWVMDDYVLDPIPSPEKDMLVAITGANSGVGFETAKALAQFSSVTVIMACRSVTKCQAAAEEIRASQISSITGNNVIPLQLDLSNFDSVFEFVDAVKQTIDKPVDVLFNNAGYSPRKKNERVNQYGLDPSFTSMHLSHHLLAELMVDQNPNLRLVTTSSGKHHLCAVPAILPKSIYELTQAAGCITEEYLSENIYSSFNPDKYITAKVANVMHASEFPLRHPNTISIAIDLGWVGTKIQPWMRKQINPSSLGWMRSASIGIHPMMHAILQPSFDRDWATQGGINISVLGRFSEPFSKPWWTGDASPEKMREMGKKLWQKSSEILQAHGCAICQ